MGKALIIDPDWLSYFNITFDDCNIRKTLKEKREVENKRLTDYEAFDLMHKYDGTFTKCERKL